MKRILKTHSAGESSKNEAKEGTKGPQFSKLPKLEIKPFYGNALEFSSFLQQFEASIGSSSLADVAKFSYLKSLVRGEAAKALGGFALTEENYANALHTLEERFGRKNLVINMLMSEFTDLKPILEIRNTKGLRSLLDRVGTGIRSLESLGIEIDTYGILLAPIIRKKLPAELNLMLSRELGKNKAEDSISEIKKFLELE